MIQVLSEIQINGEIKIKEAYIESQEAIKQKL